jgi:hypothetical protein
MEDYTDHDAPPAYVGESIAPEHQFKIRNARFHSAFTTTGQPGVSDYREHLECMKDAFLDSTRVSLRPLFAMTPSKASRVSDQQQALLASHKVLMWSIVKRLVTSHI